MNTHLTKLTKMSFPPFCRVIGIARALPLFLRGAQNFASLHQSYTYNMHPLTLAPVSILL